MKDLDKMTNSELQSLKKELETDFTTMQTEVVRVYDHWKLIESDYYVVDNELKNRGIR
jgi:hypothetical protein